MRARDLGIPLSGTPGAGNTITDVAGVEVGMVTLVVDTADPAVAARTGVTAILPLGRDGWDRGACRRPQPQRQRRADRVALDPGDRGADRPRHDHQHSCRRARCTAGVVDWVARNRPDLAAEWLLPVVAETWDGYLNSINEPFVRGTMWPRRSTPPPPAVTEGSAGGGTGMNCYGFKGGNGTSSRRVAFGDGGYTVGVFVQANFGDRRS